MNRRARWGVVITVLLVFGIAYASGATGGDDGPPVSVLSSGLTSSLQNPVGVSATTTTSRALEIRAAETTTTVLEPTTTTEPPPATTSSTRPPATTTTTRPAATTTTSTTTTTTVPPATTTTTTTTTVPPATTTTTTVPPATTTTTTIPPIVGTIHIHDLKGDDKGGDDDPYAKIEVQVRNDESRDQRGVLVIGRFSAGNPRQVSGTTNNKGKVTFESGIVDSDTVTFTVEDLILADHAYAPEDNRRGPSVTVEFD